MTETARNSFFDLCKELVNLDRAGHEVWLGWNGKDGYLSFSVDGYMVRNIRTVGGSLAVALEGLRRAFGGK